MDTEDLLGMLLVSHKELCTAVARRAAVETAIMGAGLASSMQAAAPVKEPEVEPESPGGIRILSPEVTHDRDAE